MSAVLTATGLQKSFGSTRALSGVGVALHGGEIHALLGENGAGKSTLVKILAGALPPDAGHLELNGRRLNFSSVADAIGCGVVPIYQELSLFPHLSVAENIIAFEIAGGSPLRSARRRHWRNHARSALSRLNLRIDPSEIVGDLPLAERQLVEIARALALRCAVLILDEPTASLSGVEVSQLFAIMEEFKAGGSAILFISHRLDEVFAVADRISVLRDGKLVVDGVPKQELSTATIVSAMIGGAVGTSRLELPASGDHPVLSAAKLTGRGFRDLNLVLRKGEIVGVVGLVGSGAMEVGRALAGDAEIVDGEIKVEAHAMVRGDRVEALENGVGYLPGDRALNGIFKRRSVRENASASILRKLAPRGWLSPIKEGKVVKPWLSALSVKPVDPEVTAQTLSGGNQQKVLVSRVLADEKLNVVVAVEPTRGVDVGARAEIHRAFLKAAARGLGIVVATTDLDEADRLCHRVLVMRRGQVVAEFFGRADRGDLLSQITGVA